MEYVRLGRSGMKVSRICMGCMSFGNSTDWMVEEDQAKMVLKRAWDLGINFYDTANTYSQGRSEEILGSFLKGFREDAVVATKVYNPMGDGPNEQGLSSKHIHWQARESLRRLQTEYIDLYQIHRWDYETSIDETLSTMTDLVKAGNVRYIGASSMWAWQMAKALYTSDMRGYARFVSMQNLYNLIYREEEREMNPLCMDAQVGLIPWSPTAAGILSGKYFEGGKILTKSGENSRITPGSIAHTRYAGKASNDEIVRRTIELAAKKGATPTQVSIAWLLHKGVTSPIIGTTRVDHLEEFVGSLDVKISAEDAEYLEEPYMSQSVFAHV
ncbi:MAG: aldo/keto reductase [Thaumarchaeota archaeon]|nr:aldo/keto reductase [Nitrososphaerota archaeon]